MKYAIATRKEIEPVINSKGEEIKFGKVLINLSKIQAIGEVQGFSRVMFINREFTVKETVDEIIESSFSFE